MGTPSSHCPFLDRDPIPLRADLLCPCPSRLLLLLCSRLPEVPHVVLPRLLLPEAEPGLPRCLPTSPPWQTTP